MTWQCPRCQRVNEEQGDAERLTPRKDAWGRAMHGMRMAGIECECGLTRAGWLIRHPEYQYPLLGGYVDVKAGRTKVYRAIPNDPHEYTPADDDEVVAEYDAERFDVNDVLRRESVQVP